MKNIQKRIGMLAIACSLLHACTSLNPESGVQETSIISPDRMFNPEPSSAYLNPEESLKSFNLPEGYRLELVASEPMIKEPVAVAWDGNGRMYVAEMLTYMQDADASGEQVPVSRISLLEDTDNDGKMDKSTVFIDSLLLPRMILCVGDELFVNETNTITITAYKDTDGDGVADEKRITYENLKYSSNDANMEHQRSGLEWNLDNWLYMTYEPIRLKYRNGMLKADTMASGSPGQWGITHDNYGRLFYSAAGGEVPIQRFQINPAYGALDFPDQYDKDFVSVWPIISTPDVQGGVHRLRPDSTLNHFTASCGQSIFRGDALPQDLVGDYLVCEPVGRLIRRAKLRTVKGKTLVANVYDQQEFISSSDMNFRPVNSYTGPDGHLYIVDMYRGIIQQGNWTRPGSFLREAIERWGFAENVGRGRIYRLVHDDSKKGKQPRMLNEPASKLVKYLDHPNGWWRDNAQKQLIVLGDKSVVQKLKKMANSKKSLFSRPASHLGRIHALWTLEGLDAIDKEVLLKAMDDEHEQVRKTAIWISEPFIKNNDEQIINKLRHLKLDVSDDVRTQLLLSLSLNPEENVQTIIHELMAENADHEMLMATRGAIERNENIKMYGRRLGVLEKEDRDRVLEGSAIFRSLCSSCHGIDAKGLVSNVAPPLLNSKLLGGNKNTAIRIMLHGLAGPIDGKRYPGDLMPSMGMNGDDWIASVLSYSRFEFARGPRNGPDAVSPFISAEEVRKVREFTASRSKPWTVKELEISAKSD